MARRPAPHRTDGNQMLIMAALRSAGWSVADTHMVGGGFPDLVACGYDPERGWRTLLIEVKWPGRNLTERERRWHQAWGGPVLVVRSILEVWEAIGAVALESPGREGE